MGFYEYNLVVFIAVNTFLGYLQHQRETRATKTDEVTNDAGREALVAAKAVNWQFKKRFLPVYLLVFGSDWLQVIISARSLEGWLD